MPKTRFLVRAHAQLPKLRALEIAVVISGDHNDPESWWDWADKDKQEECIKRFKRKLAPDKTDKTDPLSILVVNEHAADRLRCARGAGAVPRPQDGRA